MTLPDLFAELAEDQKRHTRRKRYGRSELVSRNEVPVSATGCILPDGTLMNAECLLPSVPVSNETDRVWTRRLPGTALRRRGRLRVDCGKGLFFIDEPDADLFSESAEGAAARPDLERDLGLSPRIRGLVRSHVFAALLYGALCNTTWRHKTTGTLWRSSWRHAGDIVAGLRCEGDYLDWYCSIGEGLIDEQVLAEIITLGWELGEANPPTS